ncbi:MAG: PAS domain S-box protein [Thermodesulfobacteriota bacterium]
MQWLFPSIVATLIGSVILASTFLFLYRSDRQPYLAIWTSGWFLYVARFALLLVDMSFPANWFRPVGLIAVQLVSLGSGVILLWGTYVFSSHKFPPLWNFLSAAIAVLIVVTGLSTPSLFWISLPTFLFLGGIHIWTGIVFIRHKIISGNIQNFVGITFILWGLHKADYPFLRSIAWFVPWGYLIGATLGVTIAIGMLMIYFQLSREKVAESEVRFRHAFENANAGVCLVNTEGRLVKVNHKMCEIFGYPKEQLEGMTVNDLAHPDDISISPDFIRRSLSGEVESSSFEKRYYHKDGHIVYGQVSTSLIRDAQGKPLYYISHVQDITKRKAAEAALQESEQRYREILENVLIGAYQVQLDGKPLFVNQTMAEMFGYDSPREFIDKIANVRDLYARAQDRSQVIDEIKSKGFIRDREVELKRKDGRHVWIKLNTRLTQNKDGVAVLEGLMEDVTDFKRMEVQLRQAQKMESVGTLAGGIAHEFNNILGIILGNTELAIGDVPESNPAHEFLKEVRGASLRARNIIRQLLSFSRKTEQSRKPINIVPVVRDSVKLLRSSIPTTIEFRQHVADECHTISGDVTQIHQIMINLCTNAADAMRDHGGVIEIGLGNTELEHEEIAIGQRLLPGRYVKLMVRDTGSGIAPENMEQIFDPYFTTKEVGKGTGMGLAVVHGIVKGHEGAIQVESEVGKGTAISIFFPAQAGAPETENDDEAYLPTGSERVLLIDDDAALIKIGGRILERLGYQVGAFMDPLKGLERFRLKPDDFDLIITDMTMPGITGDHLIQEIRDIRPGVPAILCTGFSETMDRERAKELGVSEFVMKPFEIKKIAHSVRRALDKAVK